MTISCLKTNLDNSLHLLRLYNNQQSVGPAEAQPAKGRRGVVAAPGDEAWWLLLQRKAVIPTHFATAPIPNIFADPLHSSKPGATRKPLQDLALQSTEFSFAYVMETL